MTTSVASSGNAFRFDELEDGSIVVLPIGYGLAPVDGADEIYAKYKRFRELVYIEEGGIIDLTTHSVTTDFDEDDRRSMHVAAIEKDGEDLRIVGSLRIILSGPKQRVIDLRAHGLDMTADQLPVEINFPVAADEISRRGASEVASEISRYIVRHDDKRQKVRIGGAIHRCAVHLVTTHAIESTYATVENWLDRSLRLTGVPVRGLSELVLLEKYKSFNRAVAIDMYALAKAMGPVSAITIVQPRQAAIRSA
jgi:hypothetical protein